MQFFSSIFKFVPKLVIRNDPVVPTKKIVPRDIANTNSTTELSMIELIQYNVDTRTLVKCGQIHQVGRVIVNTNKHNIRRQISSLIYAK
jgi:hypothetical protein